MMYITPYQRSAKGPTRMISGGIRGYGIVTMLSADERIDERRGFPFLPPALDHRRHQQSENGRQCDVADEMRLREDARGGARDRDRVEDPSRARIHQRQHPQ